MYRRLLIIALFPLSGCNVGQNIIVDTSFQGYDAKPAPISRQQVVVDTEPQSVDILEQEPLVQVIESNTVVRTNDFDYVSSADIRRLQQALTSLGYKPGPIDGKLGPKTKKALSNFRKAHGLEDSEAVTREVMALLFAG